jgi:hypothetical protein
MIPIQFQQSIVPGWSFWPAFYGLALSSNCGIRESGVCKQASLEMGGQPDILCHRMIFTSRSCVLTQCLMNDPSFQADISSNHLFGKHDCGSSREPRTHTLSNDFDLQYIYGLRCLMSGTLPEYSLLYTMKMTPDAQRNDLSEEYHCKHV